MQFTHRFSFVPSIALLLCTAAALPSELAYQKCSPKDLCVQNALYSDCESYLAATVVSCPITSTTVTTVTETAPADERTVASAVAALDLSTYLKTVTVTDTVASTVLSTVVETDTATTTISSTSIVQKRYIDGLDYVTTTVWATSMETAYCSSVPPVLAVDTSTENLSGTKIVSMIVTICPTALATETVHTTSTKTQYCSGYSAASDCSATLSTTAPIVGTETVHTTSTKTEYCPGYSAASGCSTTLTTTVPFVGTETVHTTSTKTEYCSGYSTASDAATAGGIPAYASSVCAGSEQYISACVCNGATDTATTTLPASTIVKTSTMTVTYTPFTIVATISGQGTTISSTTTIPTTTTETVTSTTKVIQTTTTSVTTTTTAISVSSLTSSTSTSVFQKGNFGDPPSSATTSATSTSVTSTSAIATPTSFYLQVSASTDSSATNVNGTWLEGGGYMSPVDFTYADALGTQWTLTDSNNLAAVDSGFIAAIRANNPSEVFTITQGNMETKNDGFTYTPLTCSINEAGLLRCTGSNNTEFLHCPDQVKGFTGLGFGDGSGQAQVGGCGTLSLLVESVDTFVDHGTNGGVKRR